MSGLSGTTYRESSVMYSSPSAVVKSLRLTGSFQKGVDLDGRWYLVVDNFPLSFLFRDYPTPSTYLSISDNISILALVTALKSPPLPQHRDPHRFPHLSNSWSTSFSEFSVLTFFLGFAFATLTPEQIVILVHRWPFSEFAACQTEPYAYKPGSRSAEQPRVG